MIDRKKKIEEFLSGYPHYKGWEGKHVLCGGHGPVWEHSFCIYCTHFDFDNQCCPAYPDVISERFAWGFEKHRNVEKDQQGRLVFYQDWNLK